MKLITVHVEHGADKINASWFHKNLACIFSIHSFRISYVFLPRYIVGACLTIESLPHKSLLSVVSSPWPASASCEAPTWCCRWQPSGLAACTRTTWGAPPPAAKFQVWNKKLFDASETHTDGQTRLSAICRSVCLNNCHIDWFKATDHNLHKSIFQRMHRTF